MAGTHAVCPRNSGLSRAVHGMHVHRALRSGSASCAQELQRREKAGCVRAREEAPQALQRNPWKKRRSRRIAAFSAGVSMRLPGYIPKSCARRFTGRWNRSRRALLRDNPPHCAADPRLGHSPRESLRSAASEPVSWQRSGMYRHRWLRPGYGNTVPAGCARRRQGSSADL